MQDFEIYGQAMKLGWGQEKRKEQSLNTQDSGKTKTGQKQRDEVGEDLIHVDSSIIVSNF